MIIFTLKDREIRKPIICFSTCVKCTIDSLNFIVIVLYFFLCKIMAKHNHFAIHCRGRIIAVKNQNEFFWYAIHQFTSNIFFFKKLHYMFRMPKLALIMLKAYRNDFQIKTLYFSRDLFPDFFTW